MQLSTKTIIIIIVAVILLISIPATLASNNNTAVNYEETISGAESDIQVALKRKHDLILNMVQVIQAETEFEQNTLTEIAKLRSGLSENNDIPIEQVNFAIKVAVEAYPQLQSNKDFNALMTELSVTENGIQRTRKFYNDMVRDYKAFHRSFPANISLSIVGHQVQNFDYLNYDDSELQLPEKLFE